jgi:DNA-binding response OmpR family regulator
MANLSAFLSAEIMRIIIVEDEDSLREILKQRLELEGISAVGVSTAQQFYRQMADDSCDIAIIDIGLPDANGLELAAWLRERGRCGIVMLTGMGAVSDRIEGFRSGADLYFVKPFDSDELIHAIRSLAGRILSGEFAGGERETAPNRWYFDPSHWQLQAPGGEMVKLTGTEMRFIQCLIERTPEPTPRQELRERLGYTHDKMGDQNLDALVRRLRRKLEPAAAGAVPIQTVHGVGYLFSAPLRLDRLELVGG